MSHGDLKKSSANKNQLSHDDMDMRKQRINT